MNNFITLTIFVMKKMTKMETFGQMIRRLRIEKGDPLRKVAAYLEIDQAILSKAEREKRSFKREQVEKLAVYYGVDKKEMIIAWLSDRIVAEVSGESYAGEAMKVAEGKICYLTPAGESFSGIKDNVIQELKKYPQVTKAWIFGSFARNEGNYNSDIDLMIDVPGKKDFSMFDLFQIQYDLENTLGKKIDIVIKGAIKSFAWKSARNDLKLIYERSG